MWRHGTLSLAYLTVDGASPVEHIEAAAAAGFDAAGVRIAQPLHLRHQVAVVGNSKLVEQVRVACHRTGLSLLDAEVACLGPETQTNELEEMVATAAGLGFRFVQTVVDNPDLNQAAMQLTTLAGLASDSGLEVALEFMAFRPVRDLESAYELLRQAGADNVRLLIDALHLARSGGAPAMVGRVPPELIALVQLCDAPREAPAPNRLAAEARTARLHPGEGGLWLNELLDALPDGLPVSLEVPHPSFPDNDHRSRAREAMDKLRVFLQRRSARHR